MNGLFYVIFFILGTVFGSFLCCQARRRQLKAKSAVENAGLKESGLKEVDFAKKMAAENLGLKESGLKEADFAKKIAAENLGQRSVCLSCGKQLKWYENIPIVSWIFLRGKCRSCGAKIGGAEILAEILMGLIWLGLYAAYAAGAFDLFPENLGAGRAVAEIINLIFFIMILMFTLPVGFLAIYDGLYGELPVKELVLAVLTGVIIAGLKIVVKITANGFMTEFLLMPLFSVLILGGVYLVLYSVSKGKWVGDGDWILGLALGLVLGEPWLALVTLFLANFLAILTTVFVAGVKKETMRGVKIYFGPFLAIAASAALILMEPLMNIL